MKRNQIIPLCSALLIILYVYTAAGKLGALEEFRGQLGMQVIPESAKPLMVWMLPASELLTAAALSFRSTQLTGFLASTLLMAAFTIYVGLVLLNAFGQVPCACGGVISSLGWKGHLLFNLFFLLLSVTGLIYTYRERREARR